LGPLRLQQLGLAEQLPEDAEQKVVQGRSGQIFPGVIGRLALLVFLEALIVVVVGSTRFIHPGGQAVQKYSWKGGSGWITLEVEERIAGTFRVDGTCKDVLLDAHL
jgi:hypothetical protein